MKKWLIAVGLVFLICLGQFVMLYRGFKAQEVTSAEKGVAAAKEKANLQTVETTDYYPGDHGYIVVIGNNTSGQKIVVWVQNDHVWTERMSDGVSENAIAKKLSGSDIKRITPGLIRDKKDSDVKRPIWEAYYETEDGREYYEWFDFRTGKSIRTIQF